MFKMLNSQATVLTGSNDLIWPMNSCVWVLCGKARWL